MTAVTYKKLAYACFGIAVILSYIGVGLTCYTYAGMQCAIEHSGASAPASVVFLVVTLPLAIAVLIFGVTGLLLYKKEKKENADG